MSIYQKPIDSIDFSDLEELLTEKATENIRLEFKQDIPSRDELLKKISSLSNTYGGFIVIGVQANKQAQAAGLVGVEEEKGFHQKVVQWCQDGAYPPISPLVSRPIASPKQPEKFFYVIYVPESHQAPHFLNGRKGCYVRTDEYSQYFEPQLATNAEIDHLTDRRQKLIAARRGVIERAKKRLATHTKRNYPQRENVSGEIETTMWVAICPTYPPFESFVMNDIEKSVRQTKLKARQVIYPNGTPLSQLDGLYFAEARAMNFSYLEIDRSGLIFYAEELGRVEPEENISQESASESINADPSRVYIYSTWFLAWVIFYLVYAREVYKTIGYNGPLTLEFGLEKVLGRQIRIPLDKRGQDFDIGNPILDESISFEVQISTLDLDKKIKEIAKNAYRSMTFACGWAKAFSASEEAIDFQFERALDFLMLEGVKLD